MLMGIEADDLLGEFLMQFTAGKTDFDQAVDEYGQEIACETAWEVLGTEGKLKFLKNDDGSM